MQCGSFLLGLWDGLFSQHGMWSGIPGIYNLWFVSQTECSLSTKDLHTLSKSVFLGKFNLNCYHDKNGKAFECETPVLVSKKVYNGIHNLQF